MNKNKMLIYNMHSSTCQWRNNIFWQFLQPILKELKLEQTTNFFSLDFNYDEKNYITEQNGKGTYEKCLHSFCSMIHLLLGWILNHRRVFCVVDVIFLGGSQDTSLKIVNVLGANLNSQRGVMMVTWILWSYTLARDPFSPPKKP